MGNPRDFDLQTDAYFPVSPARLSHVVQDNVNSRSDLIPKQLVTNINKTTQKNTVEYKIR